jgi:hypothetical protein
MIKSIDVAGDKIKLQIWDTGIIKLRNYSIKLINKFIIITIKPVKRDFEQ